MNCKKMKDRNREIFARFKAGQTAESLGERCGLTVNRIRVVLSMKDTDRPSVRNIFIGPSKASGCRIDAA
jgi:hypothetical protein